MSIELFNEHFVYKDGAIFWKKTVGTRAIKGNVAGKLRKDGYRDVILKGKSYLEHRIIFALHFGYLPEVVDHIDGNPLNNLISNLREADYSKNAWNARTPVNNTTGVKGIRLTKNGKYEARVAAHGVTYQIGTFESLEVAKEKLVAFRSTLHKEFTRNE